MAQPLASGRGPGDDPNRDPGLPGGGPADGRDPRLAAFAQGSPADTAAPSAWSLMVLNDLSGSGRRCAGATDDELAGMLTRWAAAESWVASAKLGVVREMIRRHAKPGYGPAEPGGLPGLWTEDLGHEIAAALEVSLSAADKLAGLAWDLEARLPGIGRALDAGVIDYGKAQMISKETAVLDDARCAQAEQLILAAGLAGKTWGKLQKIAAEAVCAVDPEGAEKRRERAEREDARVRLWRETSGTCALAAFGLPPDEALSANARIEERAQEYRAAGIREGIDLLRVMAYADILNDVPACDRIAREQARAAAEARDAADAEDADTDRGGHDDDERGDDDPADDADDDASGDDVPPDGPGPGPGGHGRGSGPGDSPGPASGTGAALPTMTNLTIPLSTLLGIAQRPGEAYGLGALDPALARDLAAAAARSARSQWCVTVTDENGYAIGHGCAKISRKNATANRGKSPPGRSRDGPWAFTQNDNPGPPDGYGTWTLTLPGGRELTVKLGPVPVYECDHRHESHSYQPSDTLRHLVQIRDGECTFPCCSRHAKESDFEHATPYHKGGKTCACNAGARSRRCHKVKQMKGWKLTQPKPGWHQWETPSGRTYTQGPKQYPA
jgi:hypothetical protein